MTGAPIGEEELQAYVDGRLAPARVAAVESWLAANPDEARRLAALRQDRDLLKAAYAPLADDPVPARLLAEFGRYRPRPWRRVAAAMAFVAVGAALGFAGGYFGRPEPAALQRDVVNAAIGAHRVFVPERRHPVEVAANEEAHLVQWLSNKLRHPLKAPDLTANGFRLVGGRLLSEGNRPAALFMYENSAGNRITIHCVPEPGGEITAFQYREVEGYGAFYWIDEKLAYAVIGTVKRDELLAVARTVYAALERK